MKTLFALALLTAGMVTSGVATSGAWAAEGITIRTNTAGELAENCGVNPREPGADARLNFCRGFAQGAVDVALKQTGDKKPFCFPSPTPTRSATLTEFVNWARALPAHRTVSAVDGLMQFLGERYPCK